MLGKMLVHGLVAAAMIASAAAVFAQAKDNGYLTPPAAMMGSARQDGPDQAAAGIADRVAAPDNRDGKREHHRAALVGGGDDTGRRDGHHDRRRHHDDDDD